METDKIKLSPQEALEALAALVEAGLISREDANNLIRQATPSPPRGTSHTLNYGRQRDKSHAEMNLAVHKKFPIGTRVSFPACSEKRTTATVIEHRYNGLGVRLDSGPASHDPQGLMHLHTIYCYRQLVAL